MEISDAQIKRLRCAPWLARVDSESKTAYLFKFCAAPEDMTCWILITDTRRVWAEVLQGRHLSRRASQVLDKPEYVHSTEKQEQRFRREQLDLVHAAHDLSKIDDMEIEVQSGQHPYAVGSMHENHYAHTHLALGRIRTPSLAWRRNPL